MRVRRRSLGVLVGVVLGALLGPAGLEAQPDQAVRFSNWEFAHPAMLEPQPGTPDELVLKLVFPMMKKGEGASLTFVAGRPLAGTATQLLDTEWAARSQGLPPGLETSDEEFESYDGVPVLRRSATEEGRRYLAVDVYQVPGGASVLVTEARGQMPLEMVGGASMMLLMNMKVHPVGTTAATAPPPPSPAELLADVPPPADLGPDPGDEVDWSPPKERIRTTLDLEELDVGRELAAFVAANQGLLGGAPIRSATRESALATLGGQLHLEANAPVLAALRAHPALQSPEALRLMAAAALLAHRPMEAMLCLWVAAERWPQDPDVLFAVASLMAQHGDASEAEALLDAIEGTGKRPEHAFGISPEQGIEYLRGYDRMRLGRFQEAIDRLRPVVAANPAFGEAALTLALLEQKVGEGGRAPFLMGVWRRPPAAVMDAAPAEAGDESAEGDPDLPDSAEEAVDTARLRGEYLVDLSKGTPGKLPSIFQPVSVEDAVRFWNWYKGVPQTLQAEAEAMDRIRNQAADAWRTAPRSRLQYEYLEAMDRILSDANTPLPAMRRLLRARDRAIEDLTEASGRINEHFTTTLLAIIRRCKDDRARACAEVLELVQACHASLRVHTQAVDRATRRAHRTWHRWATALAGLTDDPLYRRSLAIEIAFANQVEYGDLVANMVQSIIYAPHAEACKQALAALDEELRKSEDAELATCDEDQAKVSVGVEAGTKVPVKGKPLDASIGIEANCKGISVEASLMLFDSLGVSVEGEFGLDGNTTLYVGPKGKVGTEGVGSELTGKAGVYVTMNRESFTDVGARTQVKATSGVGVGVRVTTSTTVHDQSYSAFPAPAVPARGSFGLSLYGGGG